MAKISYRKGSNTKDAPKLKIKPRLQDTSRVALASLLLANLYPCFAVLFFDWSASDVVVLYWAESVIIILYTWGKMRLLPRDWDHYAEGEGKLTSDGKARPPRDIPKFFLFFYIFGSFVHGIFVLLFFAHGLSFSWGSFAIAVLSLAGSHGVSLWLNYIRREEYKRETLETLFNSPMKRLLLMHVFIIVGGGFVLNIPFLRNAVAIIFFTALKITFDLRAHLREHTAASVDAHGTVALEHEGPPPLG